MNLKYTKKALGITLALMTLVGGTVLAAPSKERGLLADGELFAAERITTNAKVLYDAKLNPQDWVWHNEKGYPSGLGCAVFVYGDGLPAAPGKSPFTGGVPKTPQMIAVAKNNNAIAANKNSMMFYVTTGPSAAQTDIIIAKVERYGRLLNVVVAMKDAVPNTPLTMNITYPENTAKISLSELPRFGNMRVRFVDMQGHALKNEDVLLGR